MTSERRLSDLLRAFAYTPGVVLSDTGASSFASPFGSPKSRPTVAVTDTRADGRFAGFFKWPVDGCGVQRPTSGFAVTALALGVGALRISRGPTKEPE